MSIIAVRVDGRLVHGQVANLWTTKLNISRIMVVDNDIVNNDIEKSGLKLSTPAGVKLSVLPVEKAVNNILAGKYDSQRLFIVARRPQTFLDMAEDGVPFDTINVGNMSQSDETRSISHSINVTDDDVKAFEALNAKGIKLTAQMVPSDNTNDLMKMLK
ncbi:PTS system sorbose subfamily IIB component [Amylolactobacillus amylotrophicus DSM 20534]|uniref:PTS system sorbose subfamily IIB component n=3 Tax=Amylolactobacillus TaxID=2767876 RepID=A0A0R1YMA0_9LACO|nr:MULTISPECIES: PTS sugar transporter subunit IIB [Amylolactobacillus]APT18347.1 PTS mannose transporter subunit IIAB [Amylolactobacillus amylophilus DSM 20533 = JCM 1125]KRK38134.1 PTS system sorbose subfamily IIB component [Amylolactobacillus amylotrophicus DSM 20534]KRM43231.1 PTS system sorbose subfamily IIB component [Amylolactobacillus amylophilus DSM 20533 = JCM 1125]GED80891.1 PTS mannose transporter subunit IIAB [Amylolactobacillus amylophilus]